MITFPQDTDASMDSSALQNLLREFHRLTSKSSHSREEFTRTGTLALFLVLVSQCMQISSQEIRRGQQAQVCN